MPYFELTTAADLFRKLEHDLATLESSGYDVYAAFNFFVTAEHLPDWIAQRPLIRHHAILRITSHLANGLKHFSVDRHDSVAATETQKYVEDGYVEPGYFEEPLLINLTESEAREFGAPSVDALWLARAVVAFWRPYVVAA